MVHYNIQCKNAPSKMYTFLNMPFIDCIFTLLNMQFGKHKYFENAYHLLD